MVSAGGISGPYPVPRSSTVPMPPWVPPPRLLHVRRRARRRRRRFRVTRRGWVVFTLLPLLAVRRRYLAPAGERPRCPWPASMMARSTGPTPPRRSLTLYFRPPGRGRHSHLERRGPAGRPSPTSPPTVRLGDLGDGDYAAGGRSRPRSAGSYRPRGTRVQVDATPPSAEVLEPTGPVPPIDPMVVRIATDDPWPRPPSTGWRPRWPRTASFPSPSTAPRRHRLWFG